MDKERKQGYQPICKGNQDGIIPPNTGSHVKMTKPEYLVTYRDYTNTVQGIYKVIGETEKYWRIRINDSCEELVRKSTLITRGGDRKYYPMTREKVQTYEYKVKLLNCIKLINFSKLSVKQLEAILEISQK